MICANRHHTLELEPRPRCQELPALALQTIREDHVEPAALLLEGVHECDGYVRCGGGWLRSFEALLGLKDLKDSGEGHPIQDTISLDGDETMLNRAEIPAILPRDIVRRFPLLLIARLINTPNKSPLF
jgi:hypothetical protein